MKPKVNVNPLANAYAMADERIIEVSGTNGGCLVAFMERDGELIIDVYRADPGITVRGPGTRER